MSGGQSEWGEGGGGGRLGFWKTGCWNTGFGREKASRMMDPWRELLYLEA